MQNKTKSVLLPILPYLPGWITRMIEDSEEELKEADTWYTQLLEREGRTAVWAMCSDFGVNTNGVPGLACRLVERYLAVRARLFFTIHGINGNRGPEWETFKQALSKKLPLTIASCIQLASKMTGARYRVNSRVVRTFLLCSGMAYSMAEVNYSEFHIYSYLGFRIALWTSVQLGEALVFLARMSPNMMQSVALFINLSEYRRDILEKYVRWAASGFPLCQELTRVQMRTLHLVAGCVVAAARHMKIEGPDPLPRMAEVTRAPLCYLRCISDIILTSTFKAPLATTLETSRLKRKLPPDSSDSSSTGSEGVELHQNRFR